MQGTNSSRRAPTLCCTLVAPYTSSLTHQSSQDKAFIMDDASSVPACGSVSGLLMFASGTTAGAAPCSGNHESAPSRDLAAWHHLSEEAHTDDDTGSDTDSDNSWSTMDAEDDLEIWENARAECEPVRAQRWASSVDPATETLYSLMAEIIEGGNARRAAMVAAIQKLTESLAQCGAVLKEDLEQQRARIEQDHTLWLAKHAFEMEERRRKHAFEMEGMRRKHASGMRVLEEQRLAHEGIV